MSIREEVIESLPRDVLAEAVRELETDDVVDILEDLEQPQQEHDPRARWRMPTGSRSNRRWPIRKTPPGA